ncbi:MAG: High-affnity carbon uptake protein Hat/HatR [Cyclobacteriaceae bacterium]|nr:High-affnity carbon uptake protein Hat/HatR [Cyclobacteriaceae bacterium]
MAKQVDEKPQSPQQQVGVANPFPGLRPFKIEESHLFFGREGQSDEVLLKMSKSRFVGVIGPSGSGKSSFIYCGVLPILYGGFLTDTSPNWEVIVTRPGANPVDNLAESLLGSSKEYNQADAEDKKIKRTIVSTLLRSSSLGLVEAIQQSRKSQDINYLILVDQFEELFRFRDGSDPNSVNETLGFVNMLMEAVNYEDAPIYVAITMRSDFIGDCAQFPELTRKINDSHYLIPQMTRDQKRRAIEGPVAVGGAKITPRLTQQLLNDLGDNPDQLPILQHALMRTWSYWARFRDYEDEPLDLKHYEAIGTMKEALSMHANEAYDELDEEQQRIAEILFKAITEKRGENFGIRRPTRLGEIASIADVAESDVMAVIEKFREPGRSLITPAHGVPLTGKSMVDISHESLMRIWVRLKNWVDDEADAVQMYLRLAEAATQYQIGKAGLWRPPDLQLALNWQAKHRPTLVWGQRYNPAFERTMIFLEYSKKEWDTEQRIKELEQKRRLQRARTTATVFGVLAIIALIALVYAFVQQVKATKNAELAEAQRIIAVAAQKEAETSAKEAKRQADIAEEARRAAEKSAQEAREAEALARQREQEANAARIRAEKAEANAKAQEAIAVEQRKAAELQRDRADQATREANRQRYLAQGKQMAVKSKELDNDPVQQSLVAQQAYKFNTANGGNPFDDDIFNGLYHALDHKQWNDPLTRSLEGHEKGAARALVTRVKTKEIYSGGSDGRILRWTSDGGTWKHDSIVGGRTDYQVYSIDVSPDDNYLVAGGATTGDITNNYIELYDLRNLSQAPKKVFGFTGVETVEFSHTEMGAYVRDQSGFSIKFTDFNTVREVIKPKEKISMITISPDGKRMAGTGNAGSLFVWDLTNNFAEKVAFKNNAPLTSVTFATDNSRRIIVGDNTGQVKIITEDTNFAPRILSGHTAHIEQIVFNNAGKFLATTSRDGTVRLWNWDKLSDNPIVLKDNSQRDWIWSAAFSPDDEQLMVGIHSNSVNAKETIHVYPTKIVTMANSLCTYIDRNMTKDEWDNFAGGNTGIKYERTCENYPENNK